MDGVLSRRLPHRLTSWQPTCCCRTWSPSRRRRRVRRGCRHGVGESRARHAGCDFGGLPAGRSGHPEPLVRFAAVANDCMAGLIGQHPEAGLVLGDGEEALNAVALWDWEPARRHRCATCSRRNVPSNDSRETGRNLTPPTAGWRSSIHFADGARRT